MKNKKYSKWSGYFAIRLFCVFLALSMTEVLAIKIRNNSSSSVWMRCEDASIWELIKITKSKECPNSLTPMYIYYGDGVSSIRLNNLLADIRLNNARAKGKKFLKKPLPTVCSNHIKLYENLVLVYPRIPKTKKKPNGSFPACRIKTKGTLYSGSLPAKDRAWLCSYGKGEPHNPCLAPIF